ncbi:MAG TPA: cytochrome c [Steroidobacteraceae bacterium]|nr:cytochrome c [Steroidobacteraceae bacterium]
MQVFDGVISAVSATLRPVLLAVFVVANTVWASAEAEDLSGYDGADLFRVYCASCHGADGRGAGPVASSLKADVPDLTKIAHHQGGQFPEEQIRRIIDGRTALAPHGTRDMPVWGQAFRVATANDAESDRLIGLLVQYLRSIQRE